MRENTQNYWPLLFQGVKFMKDRMAGKCHRLEDVEDSSVQSSCPVVSDSL